MRRISLVLASLLVSVSIPAAAFAETISEDFSQATNLGLYGGEVRDIAVDATSGTIAITTYSPNGVFTSQDGGTTWQGLPSDLDLGESRGVEIDESGDIFILMSGGLYESTDHGVTWSETAGDPVANGAAGQMVYANGVLFVGRTDGDASVSTDGGATFTTATVNADMFVKSVAATADGTTLYAVMDDNNGTTALYTSIDSGVTWSVVDTSAVTTALGEVDVDPADPLHVVLISSYADIEPWSSLDGGSTWTALDVTPFVSKMTFDSSGREYFGVDYTDDGGATWSSVSSTTPQSRVGGIVMADPFDDSVLYAASFGAIAISTDRGETWTDANTGITAVRVSDMSQSADKNTVWAATNNGLAKTTNFTDTAPTWEFPIYYDSYPQSVWVNPTTPDNVVVGGMGGVYVTTDGGATWTTATGFDSSLTINKIVQSPSDANTLYGAASYHNYEASETGDVYMSVDQGLTWTSLAFPDGTATQTLSVASDGTLYVGTGELGLNSTDPLLGIYTYDGTTWTHLEASPNDEITSVTVDPSDDTIVYATAANFNTSSDSTTAGLYRSLDAGATWELLSSGLSGIYKFTALSIQGSRFGHSANILYVAATDRATGAGVIYKSVDGGDNWDVYYTGLENETFNYLLFDGLVAGNTRGAYSLHSLAKLKFTAAENTIAAGSSVQLTIRLTDHVTGKVLKQQHVRIFKKKHGVWVLVKRVRTNFHGRAFLTVSPKHTTQFRVRWTPSVAASEEFLSARSKIVKITVQ